MHGARGRWLVLVLGCGDAASVESSTGAGTSAGAEASSGAPTTGGSSGTAEASTTGTAEASTTGGAESTGSADSGSSTDATTGAAGRGFALRFFGHGVAAPGADRVKIRVDDPEDGEPGPPVDVGATDFTIEWWMRAMAAEDPAPAVSCGDNVEWIRGNIVVDRDRYNQDRKWGVSIAGGEVVWGVSGDGTGDRTLCSGVTVLDDAWHHVAVQRRRADGWLQIFVDGAEVAAGPGPGGDVSYPDDGVPGEFCGGPCVDSDPFLVIGAEKHDAGAEYPAYAGLLDELRVSSALRYAGAFTPPTEPFVPDGATAALYHFDEGSGVVAADAAGASDAALQVGGRPPGPAWTDETPL
jgi:hypothetical protein